MLIVVTKEPIDYKKRNASINTAQGDCKAKVTAALNGIALIYVLYNFNQGRISFFAKSENKNAVASIIETDKNL